MSRVAGVVSLALGLLVSLSLPSEARYRCKDFTTAQQVIDAYRSGATYLDGNGDGYACEKTLNVYVGSPSQNQTITNPEKAIPHHARRRRRQTSASTVPISIDSVGTVHLTMGNPSGAATSADNFLLVKPQYALSYNASRGIPNWVSWQLNQSWLGPIDRQNDFRPDDSLPSNFYQVTPSDYTGSGYDRGHQAPSGDRTNNAETNSATFLMTNMIPQTADLNRGPWERLESYSRELVNQGKELYIIAGVEGKKETLAGGRITVPARNWKVIVVLDRPGLSIAGVTRDTRVIAVDMLNDTGIKETDWTSYKTTVKQIEAATGYDLLSNVPIDVQSVIESRIDP
jgi:endonuclease G, mitochondrial